MTIDGPAPTGQTDHVRTQQILCGLAILFFVGFLWARTLDWSILEVGRVKVIEGAFERDTEMIPFTGSQWSMLGFEIWLYGALLVVPNLLYVLVHRQIDQLVPALANTGVGAILTGLLIYFILDPNGAMVPAKNSGGGVIWSWTLADGAYPALVFAVAILGVGIAQGAVRSRSA